MKNQAHKLTQLLEDKQQGKNTRFIAIASGKGGVGKTTISVNLGYSLSKMGYKTALFDADIGLANLDVALKIETNKNILDILQAKATFDEILIKVTEDLYLIPGASGNEILKYNSTISLDTLFRDSKTLDNFDFVIVDTGAGIGESVQNFCNACDESIVVTVPEPSAITDAYALIKILSNKNNRVGLIVNQVKNEKEAEAVFNKISLVASKNIENSNLNIIGAINKSTDVEIAIKKRELFVKKYPLIIPTLQIQKISQNLVLNLEQNMLENTELGFIRFFKKLLTKF